MNLLETFDSYLSLPREEAYNQYLDARNLKIFKVILSLVGLAFAIIFIVNLVDKHTFNLSLVLGFVNLAVIIIARIIYKKAFNISNIRKYVFIFLIVQLLVCISIEIFYPADTEPAPTSKSKKELFKSDTLKKGDITISFDQKEDENFIPFILFFGVMVLIFRFSRTEMIQLFAIGFGVPVILMLLLSATFNASSVIPNLALGILFFVIAFTREKGRQKKFFEQYDFNYRKNYESIRMKKELNHARDIQLSMLPENDAIIGDLEISAVSLPATEVGGDYFDYFKISETEVGIFICDVSGHGVASGLMLSGLRSCMHLILEDNSNPKIVLEKLNRMIRKTQSRKMFVTAIFAIIDTQKNKGMLFNAGHLPPYKISGESKEIFKIKKHGVALGAMNNVENSESQNEVFFDFNKGDKLILYTDGVNEAMNSSRVEYGLDNLEFYLNNNANKKSSELLNGLIEDVKRFTGSSVQRDDLTLLIVQRN